MASGKLYVSILCFATILASFGCSHGLVKAPEADELRSRNTEKPEDFLNNESPEDLVKKASKKLDKLTSDALKNSAGTVQFLASDLYIKASDSSIRGDSHMAAFLFKYVQKLRPKDNYVKKRYAIELIRTGDLAPSVKILSELYNGTGTKDESIGLILGGVYTAQKEFSKAQIVYKSILENNQKSEEACVFLAKAHIRNNKYKSARAQLSRCEKRMPKKAIFSYYKGKMAIEKGAKKVARRDFKKVLKIDPSYYQGAIGLGLLLEEKENYKGAAAVYKKFLQKSPTNYSVLTRMVQILFVLGDYKVIIPYAETLLSIDPSDLNLKVRLGILYTDANRYRDAKGVFKEILKAVPNSDKVLYYLGALYQQTKKASEAINYFKRIPASSNLFHDSSVQTAQILNNLALSDAGNGLSKGEKKLVAFIGDTGRSHEGLRIELNIILAGFYEARLEFVKALKVVESVAKTKGFNEGHEYYLASLMEKTGDYKGARKIVLAMLGKNSENAHALNFLGYSYLEKNENMDLAYKYISKALRLKPNDGFIRDSMGWYYYKVGELEKAYVEIKKAWELVKTDTVIARHLAIVLRDLKKYSLAKKYLMEALKYCKKDSEKEKVLRDLESLEQIRVPASAK